MADRLIAEDGRLVAMAGPIWSSRLGGQGGSGRLDSQALHWMLSGCIESVLRG